MVILINESNIETGFIDKRKAHQESLLHRSVAVFIFNSMGRLMIQQRSPLKTTSPGLWSTTCQTHPYPGEKTVNAAHRRLQEEMGFDCSFYHSFIFKFKASFGDDLNENEISQMFIGISNQLPLINPREVNAYKLLSLHEIKDDLSLYPEKYTKWFRLVFDQLFKTYYSLFSK